MLSRSVHDRGHDPSTSMGRILEGGQVSCPIRGVVDVERCFMCEAFEGIQEGTPERLVCRPERDVEGAAMLEATLLRD
jgi:hypothetical protein